jgi:hypothetical protein
MKIGNNIYTVLKKNNTAVWAITLVCLVVSSLSSFMTYKIYKESQQNLFAIGTKGDLVPLVKLDEKKDRIKQVQGNLDYFVSLYYDLDGFTMKEKKEKVYWLLGQQPTVIMKDRNRKGYFDKFLSISGLVQHANIEQDSWRISSYDAPYEVSFIVDIVAINGDTKEYYKCEVKTTLEESKRNYPYNPYGLLITKLSESLTKVVIQNKYEDDKKAIELTNQNQ